MQPTIPPRSAWLAVIVLVCMVLAWEYFWRANGYPATPDDGRHIWAEMRGKVKKLGKEDYILTGSSRVFFDFQLDEWEEVTGRRPLQLAIAGATPLPVLQDLVNNTEFSGTIIVGVTPGLFFFAPGPGPGFWDHPASWIEYYQKRTYAQRLNHQVGKPFQHTFAFLENDEDIFYNDLDLKTLIQRIPLKGRVPSMPPFPWFQYIDDERNVTMLEKVTEDTAYAGMVKRTWQFFLTSEPLPDSATLAQAKQAVLEQVSVLVEKFQDRGGQVIFVRCPSSGWFRDVERMAVPKEKYWDVLMQTVDAPGYHFEDYSFLDDYSCPEWSHLDAPKARIFTRNIALKMKEDGLIRQ